MVKNSYNTIRKIIQEADAILIGASNGLSISEGFNIFANDAWFQENFGDFQNKYGLRNVLDGCFTKFPTEEEKWGFWSRLVWHKSYQYQPSNIMQNLYRMASGRDYFVLTSNGEDHFVPSGFDPHRVFEIEGQYTSMCCAQHCHEGVYSNREAVEKMAKAEHNGLVPTELLPKCPQCGGPMKIHMAADNSFFQSSWFHEKQAAYQEFLKRNHGKRLVILELGVGWRNQLIKEPFMRLTAAEPAATYITFNKGEVYIPQEISGKSIGVDGDIALALANILNEK